MTLTVSHCCCGCSLRSGTSIIAVYLLICSIALTISSSVMLGNMSSNADHRRGAIGSFNLLNLNSNRELRVALISGIVGGIMQTILNILLLVGVNKEKKTLVSVWLAAYVAIFVLSVLSLLLSFFQIFPNPYYQVGAVIGIGLILYFLLVVRSYHHSLLDGHNRQQNAADVYDTQNSNIKRMPLP